MGYSRGNGIFSVVVWEDFVDKNVGDVFEKKKFGCRDISKKFVRVILVRDDSGLK